jgi:hypothetical protein
MRPGIIVIVVSITIALLAWTGGRCLVVDHPERGDAIVVFAGDGNDERYHRGLQLLNAGYGRLLLVDVKGDQVLFGRPLAVQEEEFIQRSAGNLADHVSVCRTGGNSTDEETKDVQRCLQDWNVKAIVLVTSDFHTRRALSTFRCRLPQYRWSIAATRDPSTFGENWWQHREWARTALLESMRMVWWEIVDRRRK